MPPSIILFLRHLELAMRLHTAVPTLDLVDAYAHAEAATEAATAHVEPELLLAIAFVESRFDPTATSRVEAGKRKTGHYASTLAPPQLDRGTSLYCGPLQTFAGSWADCVALRRLPAAYGAGAGELEQWLRDKRVRGDLVLALAGHGCGNRGVTTGKCNHYPDRVLWIARTLHATPRRTAT
jgi:hypothetical protein